MRSSISIIKHLPLLLSVCTHLRFLSAAAAVASSTVATPTLPTMEEFKSWVYQRPVAVPVYLTLLLLSLPPSADCLCVNFMDTQNQQHPHQLMEAEEWGSFAINSSMLPTRLADNTNSSSEPPPTPCLLIFFIAAADEIIELRFTEINLRDKWVTLDCLFCNK